MEGLGITSRESAEFENPTLGPDVAYYDCGEGYLCTSNMSYHGNGSYGEFYYEEQDISFWQTLLLVCFTFLFNCFADLAVGIFHLTVDIAEKSLVRWYGGPVLCKVVRFLQELVVYASSFMLVSLSIDRVDAIARPMKFTRQAFTVRALVYAAWLTSGLLAVPSLFLFDEIQLQNQTHCIMTLHERWHWQVYITLVALTAFIIPALIIGVCYCIIIYVIWDKGRGFSNAFDTPSCRAEIFQPMEAHEYISRMSLGRRRALGPVQLRIQREQRNIGVIPQAKIRTFKMTLIIVCVFVLSWCPYFVFNLIDVYETSTQKSKTHYAITALVQSLAPLNSAANPVIYGVFSTKLCNNLRRIPFINFLFEWVCHCCRRKTFPPRRGIQSHTEQTNLDPTSTRMVNRRHTNGTSRILTDPETTTLLNHANLLVNCKPEPTAKYAAANSKWDITECPKKHLNKLKYVDTRSKLGPFYHRRPSGLPLVTRRMTSQDTLLLETYRVTANVPHAIKESNGESSAIHYTNGLHSNVDEMDTTKQAEGAD